MKKNLVFLIIIINTLFFSQQVYSYPSTDEDFALLPPYCHAKMRGTKGKGQSKIWSQRFGRSYIHVHHYCSALDWKNKGDFAYNKEKKQQKCKKITIKPINREKKY